MGAACSREVPLYYLCISSYIILYICNFSVFQFPTCGVSTLAIWHFKNAAACHISDFRVTFFPQIQTTGPMQAPTHQCQILDTAAEQYSAASS